MTMIYSLIEQNRYKFYGPCFVLEKVNVPTSTGYDKLWGKKDKTEALE